MPGVGWSGGQVVCWIVGREAGKDNTKANSVGAGAWTELGNRKKNF